MVTISVAAAIMVILVVLFFVLAPKLDKLLDVNVAYPRSDLTVLSSQAFSELVDQEVMRLRRNGPPFSISYLDLEKLSESEGEGDNGELVAVVVENILTHLRDIDLVARLAENRFAIFLPATGEKAVQVVMKKVRQNLVELAQSRKWQASFDMVAFTCDRGACRFEEIKSRADEMLAKSKTSGNHDLICVLESKGDEDRIPVSP